VKIRIGAIYKLKKESLLNAGYNSDWSDLVSNVKVRVFKIKEGTAWGKLISVEFIPSFIYSYNTGQKEYKITDLRDQAFKDAVCLDKSYFIYLKKEK